MLVHSNPMIKHHTGVWEDAKLGRVVVKSFMVKWGNHRKRWGVFQRTKRGAVNALVSGHITEAMAVVIAQRIANRLDRESREKKSRGKLHS